MTNTDLSQLYQTPHSFVQQVTYPLCALFGDAVGGRLLGYLWVGDPGPALRPSLSRRVCVRPHDVPRAT